MKWLLALGMFLQFVSFWLAAPEIIGDNGMKRLNKVLKNIISNLSIIILSISVLGYGLTFSINGIMKGMKSTETGIGKEELNSYFITVAIATILYMVFIFNFKKIKLFLDEKLAAPLVHKFTYSESFRKNSLITGAILFTFGFLIQFIIILIQP